MQIDWTKGVWQHDSATQAENRIIVAGDWVPHGRYREIMLTDPLAVYGDLLLPLRQGDLRIVNLECALIADGTPIFKDGANLKGDPRTVAALASIPFDVACLANNHTVDYGPEGLQETKHLLQRNNVQSLGAGRSDDEAYQPLVVSAGKARVGLVNFCEGEDCTAAQSGPGMAGWDLCRVVRTVRELKNNVDVIIVITHCGREYIPLPPPYVVEAFHRIAEAGPDAVLGHHAHVPQGIEIVHGVPLFYSLGNFVFDQQTDLFYRKVGYFVSIELTGKRLSGIRLIPYSISPYGLRRIKGTQLRWFFERLRCVSDPLSDKEKVREAWDGYIDSFGSENWIEKGAGLFRLIAGLSKKSGHRHAKLRNRFATLAHRELVIDAMTRIIDGKMGTAKKWALDLVREWLTLTVQDSPVCAEEVADIPKDTDE